MRVDFFDAELWEIAENLHRAELTALERDTQIARWIELEKRWRDEREKVLVQSEPKPQGGRPAGGMRAAERELGVQATDAKRAVKVASLSNEAKAAAREVDTQHRRW